MTALLGLLGGVWGKVAELAALAAAALGFIAYERHVGAAGQRDADAKEAVRERGKADSAAQGVAAESDDQVQADLRKEFGR